MTELRARTVTASDQRALVLAEGEPLPEALRDISFPTRALCFFSVGRPDLRGRWISLQSDQAFEAVRTRSCSILAGAFAVATALLAASGGFVTTSSPVTYVDYTSPPPYFLFFISLMSAMIAMVISGLSMMRWLHIDRQCTLEQLNSGGYAVISHLLLIASPMGFLTLSLICLGFAMLITGFCSQSMTWRIITGFGLVACIIGIGAVSVEFIFAWRHAQASNDGEHVGNDTSESA